MIMRRVLFSLLVFFSPLIIPAQNGVTRQVKGPEELEIRELTLKVGAKKKFEVLHLSDTHLTAFDVRDEEQKARLARYRNSEFPWADYYLRQQLAYSREHGLPVIHTGDLIDFVSEMNLDQAVALFSEADWMLIAPGNHEFAHYMGYFGPEIQDSAFKNRSYDKVQDAYPFDFKLSSKIVNGVNLVAIDNSFYNVSKEQWDLFRAEIDKGYPIVLLTHIPFFVPELYEEGKRLGWKHSGLCGTVQEGADETTLAFIAWLKEQPALKAILCGHLHMFWTERFSPSAVQYVVGGACNGQGYHITFKK